jgi:cytochrome P450
LVDIVLKQCPQDFPKSERLRVGLKPLLGESIFISNGAVWARQRRIIDPAFEGGRLRLVFPAMSDSAVAAIARLQPKADGHAVEVDASHFRAGFRDFIFHLLEINYRL